MDIFGLIKDAAKKRIRGMDEKELEDFIEHAKKHHGVSDEIVEKIRKIHKGEDVKTERGRYYIETTHRDYFETPEQREHYIKEHMEDVPFDDRVALLRDGEIDRYDEEDDVQLSMSLKEVKE